MQSAQFKIVVLGGGAAGWLTAAILSAEHSRSRGGECDIALVESPTVPTIGVGEGTWPSMRDTLRRIGFDEKKLFTHCDAAFKQGSLFCNWRSSEAGDRYYHPFSMPQGYFELDLASFVASQDYADAVSPQAAVCDAGLAPKQLTTPDYAGVLNYGYHFDAGKFGQCLREHSTTELDVKHHWAEIVQIERDDQGAIVALVSDNGERFLGDLFIDCTGSAARLIGKTFHVPWQSQASVLFNDRALAVQIPYETKASPIVSVTRSTARSSGWIWDIGLPTRRGLGYVYASEFMTDDAAEKDLRLFISEDSPWVSPADLSVRKLCFSPGHRSIFWTHNCVAVGMSAGFIEPLEASALALVEHSAALIRDLLPASANHMPIAAKRFNRQMLAHWRNIIDFLKLHYVLSKRTDSVYWQAHRELQSVPESLQENLQLWAHRAPARQDFSEALTLFPAASFRYVLNGMGHLSDARRSPLTERNSERGRQLLLEVEQQKKQFKLGLPSNRQLIETWLQSQQQAQSHEPLVGKS